MTCRDRSVARLMRWRAGILAFVIGIVPPAQAEVIKDYHPILYDTATPNRLYLVGPVTDARAPERLNQALARYPDADTLVLASCGGQVYLAPPMAYTVRAAGLRTHIPEGQACESACAFLFFAGTERSADGPLGVHQLSVADNSLGTEQIALADIVTAYEAFSVPNVVLSRMLATPPERMYRFSPEEMAGLGMLDAPALSPGRRHVRNAWTLAFVADLAPGEGAASLFGPPCRQAGDRHTACGFLYGMVADRDGNKQLAVWNVDAPQKEISAPPGGRLKLNGIGDMQFSGTTKGPHNT